MHNRIYQIESNPILPENHIDTNDFSEHWFLRCIADYVNGDVDRSGDIRRLREYLEGKGAVAFLSDDTFIIPVGGKEAYFTKAFESFKKARDKTIDAALSDFATGTCFAEAMRHMNDAYNDEYDIYVCDANGEDMIPIDKFMRYARVGVTYHIGGVLDYHC